jgi:multiple sugar transport system substrate-binding protein
MVKRLTRRDFLRLATLATGGAVLAACAPTPTATQPPAAAATAVPAAVATTAPAAAATEAPAPTTAPPAASGNTVRLGVWAGPDEVKYFNAWVKPWQDKGHNVNIEYVDWTTYWTKLPTQFSAGTAADVMEMSNYTLQFGPQGVLADQNPYITSNTDLKMEDFVAVPFEKFTYQGKLISFPMCLTIQAMCYNKDIFDKAGEAYPDNTWDWNKLVEVASKFTLDKAGKTPKDAGFDVTNVVQWGAEMSLDEESGWSALVYQNGAEYWKDNYTTANFTDPGVVGAFQFLTDMINKDKCAPSPAATQKFNGSVFQAGQAAISRVGTYMLLPYLNNISTFNWDVTVPPKGPVGRGVMADGIGWSMNSSSTVKDDAFALIKYFNTEGQMYEGSVKWAVPILKSAFSSFATPPPEHIGTLSEEFDYGHRWPAYSNQQQVDDFVGQKVTDIFNAATPVEAGLKEIQDFVGPLVKG